MSREEAEEILLSFKRPGTPWIEDVRQRHFWYTNTVNSGDRKEIANIANTLMRKQVEYGLNKKKLYDQDRRLLTTIQNLLFEEIAASLDTSVENILKQVNKLIKQ